MPPLKSLVIAMHAVSCNSAVINNGTGPPRTVAYRKKGELRLTRLSVALRRLAKLYLGLKQHDRMFATLAIFAVELRDSVFKARGAETSALWLLSLLSEMGYRPGLYAPSLDLMKRTLTESIVDGENDRVCIEIKRWFTP